MSLGARFSATRGAFRRAFDFVVEDEIVALVAPSGFGKTTALQAIAGLVTPTSGRIVLGDRVLFDADAGTWLPPEERGVGWVPQGVALFPHKSALENVAYGASGDLARARRELARVGASELAERAPRSLSGGESQRVGLARALACNPAVLLLDEPFSALDREARGGLAEIVRGLAMPRVVVTHDLEDARLLEARVITLG